MQPLTDAQLARRRKKAADLRESLADYDELEPCDCVPPCRFARARAELAALEAEIAAEESRRAGGAS